MRADVDLRLVRAGEGREHRVEGNPSARCSRNAAAPNSGTVTVYGSPPALRLTTRRDFLSSRWPI